MAIHGFPKSLYITKCRLSGFPGHSIVFVPDIFLSCTLKMHNNDFGISKKKNVKIWGELVEFRVVSQTLSNLICCKLVEFRVACKTPSNLIWGGFRLFESRVASQTSVPAD